MSDRLKSRYWGKLSKKYLNGILKDENGDLFGTNERYSPASDIQIGVNAVAREDVDEEQCTGLKDKNGKLIYEGDIVKVWNEEDIPRDGSIPIDEDDKVVGIVKWKNWGAFFDINTFLYDTKTWVDTISDEYNILTCDDYLIEIIGNIHENPELLEIR